MTNLETCERTTCTECVCRVPVANINEAGVCQTCVHFAEIAPRLEELEGRLEAKRLEKVAK